MRARGEMWWISAPDAINLPPVGRILANLPIELLKGKLRSVSSWRNGKGQSNGKTHNHQSSRRATLLVPSLSLGVWKRLLRSAELCQLITHTVLVKSQTPERLHVLVANDRWRFSGSHQIRYLYESKSESKSFTLVPARGRASGESILRRRSICSTYSWMVGNLRYLGSDYLSHVAPPRWFID